MMPPPSIQDGGEESGAGFTSSDRFVGQHDITVAESA
jgi:hypothetical protein